VTISINASDSDGLAAGPTCTDAINGAAPVALTVSGSDPSFGATVSTDGVHTIHCALADAAGNTTSVDETVKIDTRPPVVAYQGAQASYGPGDTVSISCSASDPSPGSGLAGSTCAPIAGPASGFPAGVNTFTATATDAAGNTSTATVQFTIVNTVDAAELCTLTRQDVEGSARFRQLRPALQKPIDARVTAACNSLRSVAQGPEAKRLAVAAYDILVSALAADGWLTSDQAAELIALAKVL
jgi:hypothetical protein